MRTRKEKKKAVMAFAKREDGAIVHIAEVPTGLACDCSCLACSGRLEAVNSENPNWTRRPHFRHHHCVEQPDCTLRSARRAALDHLARLPRIELPGNRRHHGETVAINRTRLVDTTSLVLTLDDGREVLVRLVATLGGEEPTQSLIPEVLIELPKETLLSATSDELRRHLATGPGNRAWCLTQVSPASSAPITRPAGPSGNTPVVQSPQSRELPDLNMNQRQNVDALVSRSTRAKNAWRWTVGPVPVDRGQTRGPRKFYQDGAYRIAGPKINYDVVLRDAESARSRGDNLQDLLEKWQKQYRLGDDLAPVTRILHVAGIICAGR